ncbi:hypothetical protein BC939DRAFT_230714 [Gamsiella multidivaricata]|uniref:uncharacterized protein n=1 Tax=Gamsiella multidivaricata TaxID=101098 RepID=UPI0022210886|nr:uncharacterized protein BC939DRAFT_230714 [Gamsiella multidivaricata]KAI7820527.1 hypothetical protein BC939DRAFT_230714 [Gamsiella multidivaricata]
MASAVTSTLASATFVTSEPTATQVAYPPNINHAAAYISGRVLTIGGLTLLFIGLCCIAVTILRFSEQEQHPAQAVDQEKALVLDQSTVNSTFPIRVYPSNQHLFLDNDAMLVVTTTTVSQEELTDQSRQQENGPAQGSEKQMLHPTVQHAFMDLGRLGRLWNRDSSRFSSVCNSPSPSQAARMPSFTTTMMQSTPVLLSASFAVPIQPDTHESPDQVSTAEELCSICLGEYAIDDRIRVLPCGHEYHAGCIDIWLCRKSTQCPLCKHDLLNDISSSTPAQVHFLETPFP